jgi:hypothetical protein
MSAKPRIFKERGMWWVSCKHGQRTGPYYGFSWAMRTAALLWEVYGPKDGSRVR